MDNGNSNNSKPGVLLTYRPLPGVLPYLQQRFAVFRLYSRPEPPSFIASFVAALHSPSIRAIVGGIATSQLIDALPNLQIICCNGVGVDKVDLDKCRERGIVVTNSPDVSKDDVADHAILLMLAVLRRVCPSDRYIRQGLWPVQGEFMLTKKISFYDGS